MTTTRRITRSDLDGNLVKIKKPEKISLVGLPANQRGFSVVREDDKAPKVENVVRRTRTRRSDDATNLAALSFPASYTKEQVEATMDTYGLKGYEITAVEGAFHAKRSDLQTSANLFDVKLTEDGVIATLVRQDSDVAPVAGQTKIKVTGVEFDVSRFDDAAIAAYLQRNSVDFSEADLDNSANDKTVLKRSDVAEGQETRRIELEPGVVAVITRSDEQDIPAGFVESVSEQAYGSWGWGQLDFNASMMDRAVCDSLDVAADRFRSVMSQILFYSDLPLEMRKTLVVRASTQYTEFVNGLLDLLPRQVLIAVVTQRSDKDQSSENAMVDAAAKDTNTPAAPAATAAPAAPATTVVEATSNVSMSRADLDAALTSAATAGAAAALEAAGIKRADPAATTAAAPAVEATAPAVTAPASDAQALMRADMAAAFSAALAPMQASLDKLSATTIVRSDSSDPAVTVDVEPSDPKEKQDRLLRGSLFPTGAFKSQ